MLMFVSLGMNNYETVIHGSGKYGEGADEAV